MNKLDDNQREAVMRAAVDAGAYQKEEMGGRVNEIRAFLTGEGGMQTVEFSREGFIAAGQRVHDKFVADKGDEFKTLIKKIRTAAE